jgi:hypothetical protein
MWREVTEMILESASLNCAPGRLIFFLLPRLATAMAELRKNDAAGAEG